MTPLAITGLIFGLMLVLMALRTPIAIAMFAAGSVGYVAQAAGGPFSSFLNTQAFARFASYDLSVIPLFILMGNFATQGGISKALFEFASVVMGRFRGGLAMAAVLASGAFGAICGSSVATAATITSVALPEMRRHGYSGRLATGTLAAGGNAGHPDPALGAARHLRDPRRAEHRQAVRRGDDPRHHRHARLHRRDRDLRADRAGPGAGPRRRRRRPSRARCSAACCRSR
jgi:hypothetical protein